MRAISLWQPYAGLLVVGAKAHETRSWGTQYRGPILVHAAKKWDGNLRSHLTMCNAQLRRASRQPLPRDLPLGAVVALADLVACKPTTFMGRVQARDLLDELFGDWSERRWAWELADVRPLPEPIPWLGSQGLWDVPPELERLVRQAMESAGVVP